MESPDEIYGIGRIWNMNITGFDPPDDVHLFRRGEVCEEELVAASAPKQRNWGWMNQITHEIPDVVGVPKPR